jgi:SAM-dependent methyltransferase
VELAEGVLTIDEPPPNTLRYRNRILQAAADFLGRPFDGVRVLDLGALEGGFAVEFALQGADVVAVEGREPSCRKIEFARDALGLHGVSVLHRDVRTLSRDELGSFDVVLCLGLLYHIDCAALVPFVRELFALTRRICIIDTHVALEGRLTIRDGGRAYLGALYAEHVSSASDDDIENSPWAALSREPSYFPTEASLRNLLTDVGFTSLFECHSPYYRANFDRRTLVACKSSRVALRSGALDPDEESWRHPEEPDRAAVVESVNGRSRSWWRRLSKP